MMMFAPLFGAGSMRPTDWFWLIIIVAVILGGFFKGYNRERR
jgi:hypothetical protein